jgi:hypothetical protein
MWRLRWGEITRVECTKVTACYAWPADDQWNRKESRRSDRCSYHETWAEAHHALLATAEDKLSRYRRELERAQGDYGRIKCMKPPADAEAKPQAHPTFTPPPSEP